jgi:hypothetical protein
VPAAAGVGLPAAGSGGGRPRRRASRASRHGAGGRPGRRRLDSASGEREGEGRRTAPELPPKSSGPGQVNRSVIQRPTAGWFPTKSQPKNFGTVCGVPDRRQYSTGVGARSFLLRGEVRRMKIRNRTVERNYDDEVAAEKKSKHYIIENLYCSFGQSIFDPKFDGAFPIHAALGLVLKSFAMAAEYSEECRENDFFQSIYLFITL